MSFTLYREPDTFGPLDTFGEQDNDTNQFHFPGPKIGGYWEQDTYLAPPPTGSVNGIFDEPSWLSCRWRVVIFKSCLYQLSGRDTGNGFYIF